MKKILIANDLLKGGGVENVLENLVRYLLGQGNEIHLMIPDCTQEEIDAFFGAKVKLCPVMRPLKKTKKFSLYWFWDRGSYVLQKILYRIQIFFKQYDVSIALKEGRTMIDLSKLYAKMKFAWIHTDYSVMHWTEDYFKSSEHERRCLMQFDKTICVSKAAEQALIRTIGDPNNLCVRYNPINYKKIIELAKDECSVKKAEEGTLFVSVGRLAYPKNYSLLIDVCKELAADYLFELWIVGDGPDMEELQLKIDTYGLNCVKLLGAKKNPFPYLNQADVFVSTSLVESYGLAIQEALILGKPVISVTCPAIEENFNEKFGVLVEATHQNLKNAMESVLNAPEKLHEYRSGIKEIFRTDELFESRLSDINLLWEK